MKEFKVYALIDPVSLKIRYIGITKTSLKIRLSSHISEVKSNREKNSYKKNWINGLLKINSKPYIKLLHSYNTREMAAECEEYLIKKYIIKHKLVNYITDEGKFTSSGKKSAINIKNKEIFVYDYFGNYISSYNSVLLCSKELNIPYSNIIKAVRNIEGRKSTHNYQFSYIKKEKMKNLEEVIRVDHKYIIIRDENKIELKFKGFKHCNESLKLLNRNICTFRCLKGALNLKYGNKYEVLVNGVWEKSTYHNTGVIIHTSTNIFKYNSIKDFLISIKFNKLSETRKKIIKLMHNNIPNIIKIEFNKPVCEVIHK